MNQSKQNRSKHEVRLADAVGGPDAWGTSEGSRVFGELNIELLGLSEGTMVPIDYSGLRRSDASFQREAVVETIRKHRPRLLFVAINLTDPDVRGNLELALEKRGEALIVRDAHDSVVLGKTLTREEQAALEMVRHAGELTSGQLLKRANQGRTGITPSTASTRLSSLWKAGLIERVEGIAASGGREYRYFPIM